MHLHLHLHLRIVDSVRQWHLEESDAADSVIASLVWSTSDVGCTIAAVRAVDAVGIMFALFSSEYISIYHSLYNFFLYQGLCPKILFGVLDETSQD